MGDINEYKGMFGKIVEEVLREYIQVSNPHKDNKTLGNIKIYVYNNDRVGYTPHCHVIDEKNDIEIEIGLIDLDIINVKNPKGISKDWGNFSKIKKAFFKWLLEKKDGYSNIQILYKTWDRCNDENLLKDYIETHNISPINEHLHKHCYG